MKMKHTQPGSRLLARITNRIRKHSRKGRDKRAELAYIRRTCSKIEKKLAEWVKAGRHREHYPTIQDIAEEMDVTREELAFYCSTRLHKSFYSWRKELRIRDAMSMILEHKDMPLCQIGFSVGIPDKSNFRHQFKSVTGCTPREWRMTEGHPTHSTTPF